ncbi:hypothetical protein BTUL_0021g00220 [Botrytis tulipae]|uniref:Uncharacterized protein n=1 Tax=Botrytis tulipae TaxID=87230 RepID=A0A4Z1EXN0_9HELO|nr:hypothetical protein BTUL_0021g00220 [Botrytis tulipae]
MFLKWPFPVPEPNLYPFLRGEFHLGSSFVQQTLPSNAEIQKNEILPLCIKFRLLTNQLYSRQEENEGNSNQTQRQTAAAAREG